MTVAMLAAQSGCLNELPDHWDHDPTLKNNKGETVAMIAT